MASLQLVRHATLLLEHAGTTWLVDPMLDPAGARPAIEGTPEPRPNPLVELPEAAEAVVARADRVLVTHLHADHLDDAAAALLQGREVLTPAPFVATLRDGGLDARDAAEVLPLTGGRHGHGELADQLGPVFGAVWRAEGEPTVLVAGDTVWCDELAAALEAHRPDVVVVNAGAARFTGSRPITMDAADVLRVADAAPRVVAVHLEAINHCLETREALRAATAGRVDVPEDGATIALG